MGGTLDLPGVWQKADADSLSTSRGSVEVSAFHTARKQRGEDVFLLGKYQMKPGSRVVLEAMITVF